MHYIHFVFFYFLQLSHAQTIEAQTVQTEPLDLSMSKIRKEQSEQQEQHVLVKEEVEKPAELLDLSAEKENIEQDSYEQQEGLLNLPFKKRFKKIHRSSANDAISKKVELLHEQRAEEEHKKKECEKYQKVVGNHNRHVISHTPEKLNYCPVCKRPFSYLANMRRHMKAVHSL
ncbi:unnamed protein product [Brugia timori]|uniref:C2H2-type domain-containing protein n=1 Tax=Brugia timori TaxID=42155 RepID=A0A0R3QCE8_9BILA|nr:unnamed protein product [Brugia timori]